MKNQMFTKVTVAGQENLIPVTQQIVWRNETVYVAAFEDTASRSVAIPARREEIQLDQSKIAELQAWREELLARFGH